MKLLPYNFFVFCLFLVLTPSAYSQSNIITNDIIRQLEKSGALDRAVERSLRRIEQKRLDEQKKIDAEERQRLIEKAKFARAVDAKKDFIYGSISAPVSIIVYSDFECPFCKTFHITSKKVADSLQPNVNIVFRNFPLKFHDPVASDEAVGSICAGEQRGSSGFWNYADAVMATTGSNNKGMPKEQPNVDPLIALAVKQQLNIDEFKRCLKSEAARARLQEDIRDGEQAGISGTPGIIIRNNISGKTAVYAGAMPYDDLLKFSKEMIFSPN